MYFSARDMFVRPKAVGNYLLCERLSEYFDSEIITNSNGNNNQPIHLISILLILFRVTGDWGLSQKGLAFMFATLS